MKQITLNDKHIALGAKMVEFAGFNMPVQYAGVNVEHKTVREGVGVFDVSHMGEFIVYGRNALNLLQKTCSNDISKIPVGGAQYNYLPNTTGGIIDDLIVYRLEEEKYFLVVNAANIDKDWAWISEQNRDFGAEMQNLSDEYSLLAVQGPKATEAMQTLTDISLTEIPYYRFKITKFANVDEVILSATGYTGSGGFEIYCKNANVEHIWDNLFEAGEKFGIQPIGLAARDTLRLEMGFCLYGNDINDSTSPFEAGLGWVTKFTKDFVNADSLQKQKNEGVSRKLVAFKLQEKGIPRQHYAIVNAQGEQIGEVTSGTMSPSLQIGIGMGYVKTEFSNIGTEIYIQVRNKNLKASVIKAPFVNLK